jgi:hypothetical protein
MMATGYLPLDDLRRYEDSGRPSPAFLAASGDVTMALIGRIFVDIFAFLAASVAAAAVIAFGFLWPDLSDVSLMGDRSILGLFVGVSSIGLAASAMGPALVLIAIAEGFGIRSVLFYACAGAAIALFLYFGIGFGAGIGEHAQPTEGFFVRELEIMAAAGIAAGLVYWLIAGRRAGAWRASEL